MTASPLLAIFLILHDARFTLAITYVKQLVADVEALDATGDSHVSAATIGDLSPSVDDMTHASSHVQSQQQLSDNSSDSTHKRQELLQQSGQFSIRT